MCLLFLYLFSLGTYQKQKQKFFFLRINKLMSCYCVVKYVPLTPLLYQRITLTTHSSALPPCDTYHSILCITTMWHLPLSPLHYHHVTLTTQSSALPLCDTYHSILCITTMWHLPLTPVLYQRLTRTTQPSALQNTEILLSLNNIEICLTTA